jgi:hypothetical protein
MSGGAYKEKRRYARNPGPFDGWIIGTERRPIRAMNLGVGGCFIMVNSERAVGETFHLRLDLEEEGLLDVSSTTLYHTSEGSAVTFLNLSQNALDQIQRTAAKSWAKPEV